MKMDQLLKAVASGAPLLVCSFDGAFPHAQELQPLSVQDGQMQARCLASGRTQTFRIECIEFLTEAVFSESVRTAKLPTGEDRHATTHH